MGRIEFFGTGTNTVTEVSSSQTLAAVRTPVSAASFGLDAVANAVVPTNITATAKGYVATNGVIPTVFGDNLNISMAQAAATSSVSARGNALTLSVGALAQSGTTGVAGTVTGIEPIVTVTGDLVSLNTTLTSVRGSGTNGLGVESEASLVVAVATNNLQNLTSVTVSGSGTASINAGTIVAADAKLATINLSGMTALANQNSLGQEVGSGPTSDTGTVGGYFNLSTSTVTLNGNIVETVTLGGAKDLVVTGLNTATATGSNILKTDIITGFQVVASAANPLVADAARSDVLDLGVVGGTAFDGAVGGNAAKMTVTGSSLEAALLQASNLKGGANGTTDIENVVFHFGGNTYVYQDVGANGLTDNDALVQLSGTLNLDLLLTSGVIIA